MKRQRAYFDPELNCLAKVCRECGKPTPLTDLQRGRKAPNGECYLVAKCLDCFKESRRQYEERYRAKHKEKKTQYRHDYYQANKDRCDALRREWEARNRDKVREQKRRSRQKNSATIRRWQERNRERLLQYLSEYRVANRERLREHDRKRAQTSKRKAMYEAKRLRRRAQTYKASGSDPITKETLAERDGLICYLCEQKITLGIATVEHVVPLSRGGSHTFDNVKLACISCNSKKGTKLLSELDLSCFR